MNQPLLEIAANSVASAVAAQEGGADRVELCTALDVGGLTPTLGMMSLARKKLRIPIHVLIRPRAGDFLYDDEECEVMVRDIGVARNLGCDGVVIGVLDVEGHVEQIRCSWLMDAALGMDVTFHRAIDVCRDPLQALEDIIALGCDRILTSGGQPSAEAGAAAIAELVQQADGRIAIMPGGGINPDNVVDVLRKTGARAVHASAKVQHDSGMHHRAGILRDMEYGPERTDLAHVRALASALA